MVAGRKRKPSRVHERNGAYRKNPQRRNKSEPMPTPGAPRMPGAVKSDPIAANEWETLCGWLDDMKIIAKADRSLMALYCTTYAEWIKYLKHVREHGVSIPTANGSQQTSPEAHQYNKLSDRMLKLLAELGLTPSARSRLTTNEQADDNPISDLLSRRMGMN